MPQAAGDSNLHRFKPVPLPIPVADEVGDLRRSAG